jgi:hypothetical protein
MYEVRVFDGKGNLKKTISTDQVKKHIWESYKKGSANSSAVRGRKKRVENQSKGI